MATQPSEQRGNSSHAEPPADVQGPTNQKDEIHVPVGSALPSSSGAPEMVENGVDGHDCRKLLLAAFKGDWESAKGILERNSALKRAKLTERSETVLHVAVLGAQDQFLEKLVEFLSPIPEALKERDRDGRTALHIAVLWGRLRMVKVLVESNLELTQLTDNRKLAPLEIFALKAAMYKEMAWFLTASTIKYENNNRLPHRGLATILSFTSAGYNDIALYLSNLRPRPIIKKSEGSVLLAVLVTTPSQFLSGSKFNVLEELIYRCVPVDLNDKPTDNNSDTVLQCLTRSLWNAAKSVVPIIKRLHEVKLKHVAAVALAKHVCNEISSANTTEITDFLGDRSFLDIAISRGISELVKLSIQFFPELISSSPKVKRLALHAVKHRQDKILRLFLKESSNDDSSLVPAPASDESRDLMFAVAKYEPKFNATTKVSGAAFQLQRELKWYTAVEKWIIPSPEVLYEGKTYWELFIDGHKELLEKGEKWVKDTTNSCMLVSTLIATVLFAAAFTVPGGNDNNTGVPLLLGQDSFLIFAISDALGLSSSVTAILLFLAILTSRYEARDFLYSLPNKIIMGLCSLFLSLACMLVAFAATLTIVLDKRLEWVLIPITFLASLPMVLFVLLQLPLLYHMVRSTYGPSIFCPEGIWDGVDYTKQDH